MRNLSLNICTGINCPSSCKIMPNNSGYIEEVETKYVSFICLFYLSSLQILALCFKFVLFLLVYVKIVLFLLVYVKIVLFLLVYIKIVLFLLVYAMFVLFLLVYAMFVLFLLVYMLSLRIVVYFQDQYDCVGKHTDKGIDFLERYANFLKKRCEIETSYASELK